MNQEELQEEKSLKESAEDFIIKIKPLINRLWEKKKLFITLNSVVLVLTVLYLLFLAQPFYQSSITILPEYGNTSSSMSRLAGLASMAGINVGETSPVQVYEHLAKSESVLKPVIYKKYKTEEFDQPVNLIEYFEVEVDEDLEPDLQKRAMMMQLHKSLSEEMISTEIDRTTEILTITVELPENKLAADVANTIAESLNNYVVTQRKSFASEQKDYLRKRIVEIEDSLRLAENKLKNFKEENRVITQSPHLQLELARLTRNVEITNQIFMELKTQIELVKLDEVKDTPVINVKEPAGIPIEKAGPNKKLNLIVIMFFSVLLSSLYIILKPDLIDLYNKVK